MVHLPCRSTYCIQTLRSELAQAQGQCRGVTIFFIADFYSKSEFPIAANGRFN